MEAILFYGLANLEMNEWGYEYTWLHVDELFKMKWWE